MPKIYIYPFAASFVVTTFFGLYYGEGVLRRWIALTIFWIVIEVIERFSKQ